MVTTENKMKELEEEIVNLVTDLQKLGTSNINEESVRIITKKLIKNPDSTKERLENGIRMVEYINNSNGQASKRELSEFSEHGLSQSSSLSPAKCGVITLVYSENKGDGHGYSAHYYKLVSPRVGERYTDIAGKLIRKINLLRNSGTVGGKTEGVYSEN